MDLYLAMYRGEAEKRFDGDRRTHYGKGRGGGGGV